MTFSTGIDKDTVTALLNAIEAGDQEKSTALLDELTQIRESELYQNVSTLTKNLHQTLDDLNDNSLLLQTKHDIPDAAERLEYVMATTEEASNKTLESAEKGVAILSTIERELGEQASDSGQQPIVSKLNELNSELNNIMLAQSFQDLTGQVLNRVILIISSLEQSLIHLIEQSGHDYDNIPAREASFDDIRQAEMKGIGPNVTEKSKQESVQSQDDVDDLLGELGI